MVPHVILLVCKDSAKFRFSEGNENKFSFLSVRKLTKSNEKPNLFGFFRDAAIATPHSAPLGRRPVETEKFR